MEETYIDAYLRSWYGSQSKRLRPGLFCRAWPAAHGPLVLKQLLGSDAQREQSFDAGLEAGSSCTDGCGLSPKTQSASKQFRLN